MKENFRSIVERHLGPPTNIEGIIRSLGIELNPKHELNEHIAGELSRRVDGSFAINVNSSDHYYRRRFTMAHELGHYMLHAHLIGRGVDDSKAYRSTAAGTYYNQEIGETEESEANLFAARLLLPKTRMLEEITTGMSVETISKIFQASKQSVEIRLKTLGFSTSNGMVTQTPT